MNRDFLITIASIALITAAGAVGRAQDANVGTNEPAASRPAGTPRFVTRHAPFVHRAVDWLTTKWQVIPATQLSNVTAGGPKKAAALARLDELERRVTRQEAALGRASTWIKRVVLALSLLIGGFVVLLLIRFQKLAARFRGLANRVAARLTPRRSAVKSALSSVGRSVGAAPVSTPESVIPSTSIAQMPRVHFHSGVIDTLANGINESRRRRGNVETGYALVGRIAEKGDSRTIIINALIDEGPNSARSTCHHRADREYQQRELELLQLIDGDAMFLGDSHLHPGSLDMCSSGDARTDSANVRASYSQELVFVIATVETARRGGRSADSHYQDGLKLDFYYLGKASAYEYRRFRPEIVHGPALSVPIDLRRFVAADPIRARLDFDNLRRLAHYHMTVSALPSNGEQTRACIVMAHKAKGFKTMIAFPGDPLQRPEVFVERDARVLEFQPSYLNGGWTGGLMWFAPIVLDIEREMTGRRMVGAGCN